MPVLRNHKIDRRLPEVHSMHGILVAVFLATLASGPVHGSSFSSSLGGRAYACPDETVTYVCVVPDPTGGFADTRWNGTIFQDQCPIAFNPDQLILSHQDFVLIGMESGTCGDLMAEIVARIGTGIDSEFNSTLTVTATANLIDTTVLCLGPTADPAVTVEIGNATLLLSRPPPAPPLSAFTCTIVDDGNGSVALNVIDLGTVFTDDNSVEVYCVSSIEASCDDALPCVDQCTGLMDGQTFTFTFFAVNCGDQSGTEGIESVTVTPQFPQAPDVNMTVQYSESGDLLSIVTTWMEEVLTIVTPSSVCEVAPPTPPSGCTIPGGFQDGDVLYYVTYEPDQGDVDTTCPVSCNSDECMDVFDQFQPGSSSYTVTVSASNVVGTTTTTDFNIDRTNNLLSVGPVTIISSSEATIDCTFSGICTADCGTDPTFMNLQPWGQSAPGSGEEIQLQPPEPLNPSTTYYCIISATVNGVNVRIQATFTTPVSFNCSANVLGIEDCATNSRCSGLLGGSISSATIPNGVVCFNGTTRLESDAFYICNDGYELLIPEGATNPRECQLDGVWSGSDITCVESCDANILARIDSRCSGLLGGSISSATIPNGVVCYNGTTRLESDALYICNDGFELLIPEGATNPRGCQVDGMWSGSDITCVESTSATPLSTGAAVAIATTVTFIVTLTIGCLSGALLHYLLPELRTRSSKHHPESSGGGQQPTAPLYEDVSPPPAGGKIELRENVAYGPVQH